MERALFLQPQSPHRANPWVKMNGSKKEENIHDKLVQTCAAGGEACRASWAHIICCSSRSTCCNRCSSRVAPIGAWRSVGHGVWNSLPREWPASLLMGCGILSHDCMWSISFLYNMPDSWNASHKQPPWQQALLSPISVGEINNTCKDRTFSWWQTLQQNTRWRSSQKLSIWSASESSRDRNVLTKLAIVWKSKGTMT